MRAPEGSRRRRGSWPGPDRAPVGPAAPRPGFARSAGRAVPGPASGVRRVRARVDEDGRRARAPGDAIRAGRHAGEPGPSAPGFPGRSTSHFPQAERVGMADAFGLSRRALLQAGGVTVTGAALGAATAAAAASPPGPTVPADTGAVQGGRVQFPNWRGQADRPPAPTPAPQPPGQRVGYCVVGLGRLSLEEILPAFGAAKRARIVAVMSGTPDKAKLVARQYGVAETAVYGYGDWDALKAKPGDPGGLHRHPERGAPRQRRGGGRRRQARAVREADGGILRAGPRHDRRLRRGEGQADDRLSLPVRTLQPRGRPHGAIRASSENPG